jgi:uncharacterized surface protein with fasciclin (FAS1) repeats
MKKILRYKILTGLLILLACSCTDKNWDNYYVRPDSAVNGNTFDILAKNPNYREFARLLKKARLDSILRSPNLYTVFALRNGAFAGIDTVSDLVALKKIMGMHLVPSAVYKEDLTNNSILGASGKLLKFASGTQGFTVNNFRITTSENRTANGVYYEVEKVILPVQNLHEIIYSNPDLTAFKSFVGSSYKAIIDPVNNIRIGFDTLNAPIYQAPVKYVQFSEYLSIALPQDEKVLTTGFFPSNAAVSKVVAGMLTANGGRTDMIAPRLSTKHGDTIVGGRFFKSLAEYKGDTAVLLDNLFKTVLVRGEIAALSGTTNKFTNILGGAFNVAKSQVKSDAKAASNGYYYVLDDVTVPEMIYRKEFMFLPTPKIQDPANPLLTIPNPNIIYSNEANNAPAVVTSISTAAANPPYTFNVTTTDKTFTGRYTRFNFTKVGAMIDFVIPYATKGYYRVVLGYIPEANNGMVSASYGGQQLLQNINTSMVYNARALLYVAKDIGTINVLNHGAVQLKFTCTGSNPVTFNQYTFCVDFVRLEPVSAPN